MLTLIPLDAFGIYKPACQLFDSFFADTEIAGTDYRGRELIKQIIGRLTTTINTIESKRTK
jgi:hypothetical protein